LPPSIYQYGGRYIARSGKTETLEGDWSPPRFVILGFEAPKRPCVVVFTRIRRGQEAPAREPASSRMLLVEGLPPGWTP
jgi:uncharacterized protein (DUF1330 family)